MSRLTVMGTMPSPAFQQPVVGLKPTTPVMPAGILHDPPACDISLLRCRLHSAIISGQLMSVSGLTRTSGVAGTAKTPGKAAHPCLSKNQLCPCAWRLPLRRLRCFLEGQGWTSHG